MSVTTSQVEQALTGITDPCSVSVGVPLSIVEMGLIDDIMIDEANNVLIELRLTSPGCLVGVLNFEPEIESLVSVIPGVASVRVHFNDPLTWTEDRVSPEGRQRLQKARASRRQLPVVDQPSSQRHRPDQHRAG